MSSGGQGDYHPLAVEVARRRREDIIAIVQEAIRRLVAGEGNRLVPKSLPPGVLIDRGDWLAGARYRPGDLVIAGGSAYVAVAPSGGAAASVEPPDTAYWRPIGTIGTGMGGTGFGLDPFGTSPFGLATSGIRVMDEALALGRVPLLNFTGAGVTATLNAPDNRIDVAIVGGGAASYLASAKWAVD